MSALLIDPHTGEQVDPAVAGAYLQRSIVRAKSGELDRLVAAGKVKANPLQTKRNAVGDVLRQVKGADSAGNFGVYLTEVFDPLINKPLWTAEYQDNITVVSAPFGAEATSYLNQQITGAASRDKQGIAWAAAQQTDIPRTSAEFAKTLVPLAGWARQASFDVFEIARAQRNGIPLEMAVLEAIGIQWELDTNIVAHLGSYAYGGYGLFNQPSGVLTPLTPTAKAADSGTRWVKSGALNATPQEILADVRKLEHAAWVASGYTQIATDLRIDPVSYVALTAPLVIGTAAIGASSILEYIAQNSLCFTNTGRRLNIKPSKFLLGTTAGSENSITVQYNATGSDQGSAGANCRAVIYTNDPRFVQMHSTNPFALQIQYQGLNYNIPYVGQLPAGVEWRYSNTVAYMDAV